MLLTDTECRNLKPSAKTYKKSDGQGLFLEIRPNGAKYWRLKYRYLNKEKKLGLGVYPEISLKEARQRKSEARKLLDKGEDPSAVRKRAREEAILEAGNTFEKLAKEWFKKNKARWDDKHAEAIIYRLEKDIFPDIGNLPIKNIIL